MFEVVDGLNGSRVTAAYAEECIAHGVSAIHVTVNNFSRVNPLPSLRDGLAELAACRSHFESLGSAVRVVERYDDFAGARAAGQLAVVLGYQNVPGIDRDLKLLDIYRDLGVRVIQIAHNVRNLYGDGCAEQADAGLSSLGRELVAELNRLHILVDLSHMGERSGLEAIELSQHPVAATHANALSVCRNVRNKSDATLQALAERGGVLGVCYLPPIVRSDGEKPSHADVAAHVQHAVALMGVSGVAIGSDFITGQPAHRYEEFMRRPDVYGTWPWRFPVDDLADQQRFLESLSRIGLAHDDIAAIAGGNLLRVFQQVMT